MLKKSSFDFLSGLAGNNTREWFDKHRSDYQETFDDFALFNQNLINSISEFDQSIAESDLQSKDCIPKLNRDLRFVKDKSPYKTYFYSIINSGGRKSGNAGYYIILKPGECYIAAGEFQPEPKRLKKVRQEIEYNFEKWSEIVSDTKLLKAFPGGIIAQQSLQKVPKDFDSESPAKEFLKMKGFFVERHYPDSFFRAKDSFEVIIESFKTCRQLNNFVNLI